MSTSIAQHVRFKFCTFPSGPLQNNIKSPKFAWFEEGNNDSELFPFVFGT